MKIKQAKALSPGERYETLPPKTRDALGVFPQAAGELIVHALYLGAVPVVYQEENGNLHIRAAHFPIQLYGYVPEYEI